MAKTSYFLVNVDIPLVFMTYLNVLFRYGYDRFCRRAADSGISGVIVPGRESLPLERYWPKRK